MLSVFSDNTILTFSIVVAAMFGAVMGSFLNCVAWRIAHEEKWWTGRSHCPSCGHALGLPDLVPLLSWLLLRGKCRHCGAKIPVRYFLTELFYALCTVLVLLRFDLSVLALRNYVFVCCLFCLALVDLEIFIIPDGCLLIAAGAWVAALPFVGWSWGYVWPRLLAALVFGGGILLLSLLMDKLLHKESLGGGDVKLFAVVGLYLGLGSTLLAVLLSCVLGLLLGLVRRGEDQHIPFGPAISLAAFLVLLWGEPVLSWYLGLFGI